MGGDRRGPGGLEVMAPGLLTPDVRVGQRSEVVGGGSFDQTPQS